MISAILLDSGRVGLPADSREAWLSAVGRTADDWSFHSSSRASSFSSRTVSRCIQPCRDRRRGAIQEFTRRQQGCGVRVPRDRSGLAAAVDIPAATVISLLFNLSIIMLWYTDFGNSPVELEGTVAKRLKRARELARTGTFVAQIDNEVLQNMNREQLEGLAQRALKRAHSDGSKEGNGTAVEKILRLRTRDASATRRGLDLVLGEFAREYRMGAIS